jgi:hypothetical protein
MRGMAVCLAAALLASLAASARAEDSPANTTPPPPHAQPQAPDADLAGPAAIGPAQATSTSGPLDSTPLGATGQTMPSTISQSNATLDRLPTIALEFPLTDEQKALVAKSVNAAPNSQTKANLANTHVAMTLPLDVQVQPFSNELIQQVPGASRYKYVKLDKRVLIIDPIFLSVVGEVML